MLDSPLGLKIKTSCSFLWGMFIEVWETYNKNKLYHTLLKVEIHLECI